jgi:hypothetical protein
MPVHLGFSTTRSGFPLAPFRPGDLDSAGGTGGRGEDF